MLLLSFKYELHAKFVFVGLVRIEDAPLAVASDLGYTNPLPLPDISNRKYIVNMRCFATKPVPSRFTLVKFKNELRWVHLGFITQHCLRAIEKSVLGWNEKK